MKINVNKLFNMVFLSFLINNYILFISGSNNQVSIPNSEKNTDIAKLKETLDFFNQQLKERQGKKGEIEKNIEDLEITKKTLKNSLLTDQPNTLEEINVQMSDKVQIAQDLEKEISKLLVDQSLVKDQLDKLTPAIITEVASLPSTAAVNEQVPLTATPIPAIQPLLSNNSTLPVAPLPQNQTSNTPDQNNMPMPMIQPPAETVMPTPNTPPAIQVTQGTSVPTAAAIPPQQITIATSQPTTTVPVQNPIVNTTPTTADRGQTIIAPTQPHAPHPTVTVKGSNKIPTPAANKKRLNVPEQPKISSQVPINPAK